MSKKGKRKTGECAYCGEIKELSVDHVIPKCLFVEPYPPDLITVKACDMCNSQKKSLDDAFLRDMLTLDLFGNASPVAQDIFHDKVLSALRQNKSPVANAAIRTAHLEPFYSIGGIYLGHFPSFPIDEDRVTQTFSTIVWGLYYNARKQILPSHYEYEVRRFHSWDFPAVWREFSKRNVNGPRILGNVFGGAFLSAQEDAFTTLWMLWFYERIFISVAVTNPDLEPTTE